MNQTVRTVKVTKKVAPSQSSLNDAANHAAIEKEKRDKKNEYHFIKNAIDEFNVHISAYIAMAEGAYLAHYKDIPNDMLERHEELTRIIVEFDDLIKVSRRLTSLDAKTQKDILELVNIARNYFMETDWSESGDNQDILRNMGELSFYKETQRNLFDAFAGIVAFFIFATVIIWIVSFFIDKKITITACYSITYAVITALAYIFIISMVVKTIKGRSFAKQIKKRAILLSPVRTKELYFPRFSQLLLISLSLACTLLATNYIGTFLDVIHHFIPMFPKLSVPNPLFVI